MARAAAAAPTRTPEEEYSRQWRLNELNEGLARGRRTVAATERRIAELGRAIEAREAYLATLLELRAGYVNELDTLPPDHVSDEARSRRKDLWQAIAVLDGAADPVGTILDQMAVEGKLRIPGARRQVEATRAQLAEEEAELARVRHGIAIAERKLKLLA
jgi:hypothetical protein